MNALLSLSAFYVVFLSNEHESYQPLPNKVSAVLFLNVNGLLSQCILMLETNRFVLLNVDTIDGLQLSLLHGLAYDLSLQPKLK